MINDLKKANEARMKKTVSVYEENLGNIRAGRANPQILNNISVDYYGQMTPINQVAGISAPEPRLITIAPWDVKLIPEIEKIQQAMEESDALTYYLSGAGSTIMLVLKADDQISEKQIREKLGKLSKTYDLKVLEIDKKGAFII